MNGLFWAMLVGLGLSRAGKVQGTLAMIVVRMNMWRTQPHAGSLAYPRAKPTDSLDGESVLRMTRVDLGMG